jgi:hypothetical protein
MSLNLNMSFNLGLFIVHFDWGAVGRLEAGKARKTTNAVVAKQAATRLAGRLIAGARS